MWLAHSVALASVFVLLVCMTEGKPKIELPDSDDDFLELLAPGDKGITVTKSELTTCPCPDLGGDCRCVKFGACLDPRPKDIPAHYGCFNSLSLFDERTIIGINTGPCGNLGICCKCSKGQNGGSSTAITTTPKPLPTPSPPGQCGKRNPNGVDVTVQGFRDNQAQLGEFPWMVAVLGKDSTSTYVAGASLVHPRVILTAGHKVHGKNAGDLVARIGDWDLTEKREHPEPQNIDVDRIVYHSKFVRPKHENNVALLILKKAVVYNKLVMPICLPQPNQDFDGSDCFVTGWGKDVFGALGGYQTIMKKIPMPIVSQHQCQSSLRNTRLGSDFTLHNSFVCAGGQGEDACTGDGGSPLVCPDPANPTSYVQVGVVSWGIGCATIGNPGVYGSIPKTVEWITETIQKEAGGFEYLIDLKISTDGSDSRG